MQLIINFSCIKHLKNSIAICHVMGFLCHSWQMRLNFLHIHRRHMYKLFFETIKPENKEKLRKLQLKQKVFKCSFHFARTHTLNVFSISLLCRERALKTLSNRKVFPWNKPTHWNCSHYPILLIHSKTKVYNLLNLDNVEIEKNNETFRIDLKSIIWRPTSLSELISNQI